MHFTDPSYKNISCRANYSLIKQRLRDNCICTSMFDSRRKFKCLETKARYNTSCRYIFGKKLLDYKITIWLLIMSNFHSLWSGNLWFILQYCCSHMGLALEGASVYFKLQAIVNSHCSCYECHIPWWCSLSWKVYNSLTSSLLTKKDFFSPFSSLGHNSSRKKKESTTTCVYFLPIHWLSALPNVAALLEQ